MKRNLSVHKDKHFKYFISFILSTILGIIVAIYLVIKVDFGSLIFIEDKNVETRKIEENINKSNKEMLSKDYENNENNKPYLFDLDEVSLYNVQVGSFTRFENAKKMTDELRQLEIAAYIFNTNESYKVFVGSFFERDTANDFKRFIKNKIKDAFISEKNIKGKQINIENNLNNKFKNLFNDLNKFYSVESSMMALSVMNNEFDEVLETIKKDNLTISKQINDIMKATSSEETIVLLDELLKNLSLRKNVIIKLENEMYIDANIEFNKAIVNYVNSLR